MAIHVERSGMRRSVRATLRRERRLSLLLIEKEPGVVPGSDIAGGVGDPPSLCQEGKRKLTESAREFPKASA